MDSPATSTPFGRVDPSSHLFRKLSTVYETSVESANLQLSLSTLPTILRSSSDAPFSNTYEQRKLLRTNIESKILNNNKTFLNLLSPLYNHITLLNDTVAGINSDYKKLSDQLNSSTKGSLHILNHTNQLKSHASKTLVDHHLINLLLDRFTLSNDEISILSSISNSNTNENINLNHIENQNENDNENVDNIVVLDDNFFNALDHINQIQQSCYSLLTSSHQKLGKDILNELNQYQETCYNLLFKYIQSSKGLFKLDNPEIPINLKTAISSLKNRPLLFQSCLETLTDIRKNVIIKSFTNALTIGGPDGFPKPIEFHASDPLRYTGDMLAWIHQTAANEKEMLENLLNLRENYSSIYNIRTIAGIHDNIINNENKDKGTNEEDPIRVQEYSMLMHMLDLILSGTSRPLQIRIEQILQDQLDLSTIFRITNLIKFYLSILEASNIGNSQSVFIQTLKGLSDLGTHSFNRALSNKASEWIQSSEDFRLNLLSNPNVLYRKLSELSSLQENENVINDNHILNSSIISYGKETLHMINPKPFEEAILELKNILNCYDESLIIIDGLDKEIENGILLHEEQFRRIILSIIEPINQLILILTRGLNPNLSSVISINCLNRLKGVLNSMNKNILNIYIETIDTNISQLVDQLLQNVIEELLKISGISDLLYIIENPSNDINQLQDISSKSVIKLDKFLLNGINLNIINEYYKDEELEQENYIDENIFVLLNRLHSKNLQTNIKKEAYDKLIIIYDSVIKQLNPDIIKHANLRSTSELSTLLLI